MNKVCNKLVSLLTLAAMTVLFINCKADDIVKLTKANSYPKTPEKVAEEWEKAKLVLDIEMLKKLRLDDDTEEERKSKERHHNEGIEVLGLTTGLSKKDAEEGYNELNNEASKALRERYKGILDNIKANHELSVINGNTAEVYVMGGFGREEKIYLVKVNDLWKVDPNGEMKQEKQQKAEAEIARKQQVAELRAKYRFTSPKKLEVKSGPGKEYKTLEVLQKNESVEVVAKDGKWDRIKVIYYINGYEAIVEGYVESAFLQDTITILGISIQEQTYNDFDIPHRSKKDIISVAHSHAAEIRALYNKFLRENKEELCSEISIGIIIATSGDVTEAEISYMEYGNKHYSASYLKTYYPDTSGGKFANALKNQVAAWKWKTIESKDVTEAKNVKIFFLFNFPGLIGREIVYSEFSIGNETTRIYEDSYSYEDYYEPNAAVNKSNNDFTTTNDRDIAQTYKAEFNCDLASSAVEIAICSNKELAAMDLELNSLYKPKQKALKESQREWIKKRNQCGGDVACLTKEYKARVAFLKRR